MVAVGSWDGKEFEAKNGSTYAPDQTLSMSGDLDQGERQRPCEAIIDAVALFRLSLDEPGRDNYVQIPWSMTYDYHSTTICWNLMYVLHYSLLLL